MMATAESTLNPAMTATRMIKRPDIGTSCMLPFRE
jgi:hypothetical protein